MIKPLLKDVPPSKTISTLSNLSRGEPCWLKLPHVCDGGTDTVVYAHYRDLGLGFGLGKKGMLGAPACRGCHDAIDGRSNKFEREWVRKIHLEQSVRYWWQELKGVIWDIL